MIQSIKRMVKIELPRGQSAFLRGPRKTGKTTYLRAQYPNSLIYDLLQRIFFLN